MTRHAFGGDWTEEKLERVRKYLVEYTIIFKGNVRAQKLKITYVDAFAGTGHRSSQQKKPDLYLPIYEDDPEREAFINGSAKIALSIKPSFDAFLFIERDKDFAIELENLKSEFAHQSDSIQIVNAEANSYLREWCRTTDWSGNRAVVFLDPYGTQVEWSLLEAIAKTRAIDLWILFPLGVAINRLLTKEELPPPSWSATLTRLLGTAEWEDAFYKTRMDLTLFGLTESRTKEADYEAIGQFFVERLKSIFPKVAENPLPLRNSKNVPLYLLCFAASNPAKADLAVRIAGYILGKKDVR